MLTSVGSRPHFESAPSLNAAVTGRALHRFDQAHRHQKGQLLCNFNSADIMGFDTVLI